MNRYGDTPLGMVESALEFVRLCRKCNYHEIILSMKASNPKVMIEAYRLLVARLNEEGPDWNYPLHLGVTEAGEGRTVASSPPLASARCSKTVSVIRCVSRSPKTVCTKSRFAGN